MWAHGNGARRIIMLQQLFQLMGQVWIKHVFRDVCIPIDIDWQSIGVANQIQLPEPVLPSCGLREPGAVLGEMKFALGIRADQSLLQRRFP